jgi:hypothetical protein
MPGSSGVPANKQWYYKPRWGGMASPDGVTWTSKTAAPKTDDPIGSDALKTERAVVALTKLLDKVRRGEYRISRIDVCATRDGVASFSLTAVPEPASPIALPTDEDMGLNVLYGSQRSPEEQIANAVLGVPVRKIDL